MERSWIGLGLLVMLGASEMGCGSACESARARIENRYAECEIPVEDPADPSASEVCSATEAEYTGCVADCTESATCEALDGSDPQGGVDFGACFADCSK